MQNRNAIKVFAILFAIVSLYQLSFTWVASGVEDDALEYSEAYVEEKVEKANTEEELFSDMDDVRHDSLLYMKKVEEELSVVLENKQKFY